MGKWIICECNMVKATKTNTLISQIKWYQCKWDNSVSSITARVRHEIFYKKEISALLKGTNAIKYLCGKNASYCMYGDW